MSGQSWGGQPPSCFSHTDTLIARGERVNHRQIGQGLLSYTQTDAMQGGATYCNSSSNEQQAVIILAQNAVASDGTIHPDCYMLRIYDSVNDGL